MIVDKNQVKILMIYFSNELEKFHKVISLLLSTLPTLYKTNIQK